MTIAKSVRVAKAFARCVSVMRDDLTLWTAHAREFEANVENTTLAIIGVGSRKILLRKLMTISGIIVAMHRSSVGKEARMIACDALVELDTLSMAACGRRAANAHRLQAIITQDAKDRGVRAPRRTTIATLAPVFA